MTHPQLDLRHEIGSVSNVLKLEVVANVVPHISLSDGSTQCPLAWRVCHAAVDAHAIGTTLSKKIASGLCERDDGIERLAEVDSTVRACSVEKHM